MKQDELVIRIYFENGGKVEDGSRDMGLDELGGVLPAVGDCILNSGVVQGLDRYRPENREMWEVRKRVFNPRDNSNYIALVVKARRLNADEEEFAP